MSKIKKDNNIYLIYTMGKVGSTTVFENLRKNLIWKYTFTTHFLSDKFLNEYLPKMDPLVVKGCEKAFAIKETIQSHPERRLKIITLVRDPIMRDFSDIFEKWAFHFGDKKVEDVKVEDILEIITRKKHHHPLNWFDNEFKAYLKFDIYDFPFDKKRGYSIYEQENFDLLCIQLEKLDACYQEAFSQFLGIQNVDLTKANTRTKTKEYDLYQQAKKKYHASPAKIKKVYNSKFVKHFYNQEMIDQFIAQWSLVKPPLKKRMDKWLLKLRMK